MNPNPNAGAHGVPRPVLPKASVVPYFLAQLVMALLVFVVVTVFTSTRNALPFGAALLDYATVHMPVPLVLSAVLSWLLTRRMRPPFWAILVLSLLFYPGALFLYEMGLLMASTQR